MSNSSEAVVPPSPLPSIPDTLPTGSPSLWDRISTWASDNKALVYTIAGITVVVTVGGAVYYFSDSGKVVKEPSTSGKRKSKKDRKKTKKDVEQAAGEKAQDGTLSG